MLHQASDAARVRVSERLSGQHHSGPLTTARPVTLTMDICMYSNYIYRPPCTNILRHVEVPPIDIWTV